MINKITLIMIYKKDSFSLAPVKFTIFLKMKSGVFTGSL